MEGSPLFMLWLWRLDFHARDARVMMLSEADLHTFSHFCCCKVYMLPAVVF